MIYSQEIAKRVQQGPMPPSSDFPSPGLVGGNSRWRSSKGFIESKTLNPSLQYLNTRKAIVFFVMCDFPVAR